MLAGIFGVIGLIAMFIYFPRRLLKAIKNSNNKSIEVKKIFKLWAIAFVCWFLIGIVLAGFSTNENKREEIVQSSGVTPQSSVSSVQSQPVENVALGNNKNSLKADSGIEIPYTKKNMPKLYANWGAEWVKKINEMMPKVVDKVAQNPKCDSPELVDLSDNRSVVRKEAVFFVDCKNGERFYVSQKDLLSGDEIKSESEQLEGEPSNYIQPCRENIQSNLQYPSSFDDEILSTTARKLPNGSIEIIMPFTAKNGFGNEIPQTARCLITTDKKMDVTLVNR